MRAWEMYGLENAVFYIAVYGPYKHNVHEMLKHTCYLVVLLLLIFFLISLQVC